MFNLVDLISVYLISTRPTNLKDSHRNKTLLPKKRIKRKIAATLGLDQTVLVVSSARKAH